MMRMHIVTSESTVELPFNRNKPPAHLLMHSSLKILQQHLKTTSKAGQFYLVSAFLVTRKIKQKHYTAVAKQRKTMTS